MSKKKKIVVDERDEKNKGIASQWALRVVIFYTLIKIIYYLDLSALEDLGFLLWDGLLLIVIGLTFFVVTRMRKTFNLPKTYLKGEPMEGDKQETRGDRVKKSYIPKALSFSAGWLLVSTLRSGFISILVLVVQYILYFLITFVIVFAWGEWNVRSYKQSFEE